MSSNDVLVRTINLKKYYEIKSKLLRKTIGVVKAVDGVSLEISKGETLGIVGESGSGKTTLGMVLGKLIQPTDGKYLFNGMDITMEMPSSLKGKIRVVFQDPYSSLNPRLKIKDSLIEPLLALGYEEDEAINKAVEYLELVGLKKEHLNFYPHMLSGGQKQRVLIARALVTDPLLVILDEPTSMLDVSTQAQVLMLLKRIKMEKEITYVFITHNLAVARYISDTIAVMFAGQVVEMSSKKELFENPLHPYTKSLISAYPPPDPTVKWTPAIPDELTVKYFDDKCRYIDRCPLKTPKCEKGIPELIDVNDKHKVRCVLYR
jgi:oligopeptide/dipeptide ABC transporter ATP-binding protein